MKKYITSTLILFLCSHFIQAQGNSYPDIGQISTPYKYLNEGSFYGKNFFFEKTWVKAKLLMADNSVVSNDSFLFNFDKIDHRLLITADFKSVYEIDRREFKAVLFYGRDTAYIFKHMNFINDRDLFQIIVNGKTKYSLYKVMRTKLVKGNYSGNYTTPGARATDTYLDVPQYFIFFPNGDYHTISLLKKGSIERAFKFNPDSDKVDEFLKLGGGKDYAEDDLIQLVLYLNRETL